MLTRPRDPLKMLQNAGSRKKHQISPRMLAGVSVPVILVLIAGAVFGVSRLMATHAANNNVNMNCTLVVPPNPLTAQGLATPYQLMATNADMGPCNEANANQSAFVQATIFNPANNTFAVYSPLVVNAGTQPAVMPVVPNLPANAVVGIWFGFNGMNLTLANNNGSLMQGNCVNGLQMNNGQVSVFGQFAYCNAVNFFTTVNNAIAAGNVQLNALANDVNGLPCPTNRSFFVVDQDQSDNVQTMYLANGNGQTAQFTATNLAQIANATVLSNPSDNALITNFIDPTLGCTPMTAPDLANNNNPVPSLALDELFAAANQQPQIALIPGNDPMAMVNNNPNNPMMNINKVNLYRAGVDQMQGNSIQADANPTTYCANIFMPATNDGIVRFVNESQTLMNGVTPNAMMATNLQTFLAMRLNNTFMNLGCMNLLNMQNPVKLVMNNNIVVGDIITINGQQFAFGMVNTKNNNNNNNGNTMNNGNAMNNGNNANNANNGDNANNANNGDNANNANNGNANGATDQPPLDNFQKW